MFPAAPLMLFCQHSLTRKQRKHWMIQYSTVYNNQKKYNLKHWQDSCANWDQQLNSNKLHEMHSLVGNTAYNFMDLTYTYISIK